MSKRIPKTLYHYCGLSTFQKIIESSTIWLSDISQSNDSQEMKWIYNEFYLYFLDKLSEYTKSHLSFLEECARDNNIFGPDMQRYDLEELKKNSRIL